MFVYIRTLFGVCSVPLLEDAVQQSWSLLGMGDLLMSMKWHTSSILTSTPAKSMGELLISHG